MKMRNPAAPHKAPHKQRYWIKMNNPFKIRKFSKHGAL